MKSQKNEIWKNMKSLESQTKIQKKRNLQKKWKQKIFRTQSMSVSDNLSVRQSQDLVNVSVRVYQCQIMSGSI